MIVTSSPKSAFEIVNAIPGKSIQLISVVYGTPREKRKLTSMWLSHQKTKLLSKIKGVRLQINYAGYSNWKSEDLLEGGE